MCSLLFFTLLYSYPSQADRGKRWVDPGKWQKEKNKYAQEDHRGYRLDNRHHHNRYYPKYGDIFETLPRGNRTLQHRHNKYHFFNGTWYYSRQNRFIVGPPPIGMSLSFLPDFYTTIWVGNIPYYYAAGVYYRWLPSKRVYIVSEPPEETVILEQPDMPDQLFIYPKEGQSVKMQADDRFECHRWSSDQTGFDPTQSGGNVPERFYDSKKADYYRAMKVCLEARGYSVR